MRLSLLSLFSLLGYGLCQESSNSDGDDDSGIPISWIGEAPSLHQGVTFGIPWPRGEYPADSTSFELLGDGGETVQDASWVTGYWPDGSVKWSAHAVAPSSSDIPGGFNVRPIASEASSSQQDGNLTVEDSNESIHVDTGALSVDFAKSGNVLVNSIQTNAGKTIGQNGRLILRSQSAVSEDSLNASTIEHHAFQSAIDNVTVSEESGIRALATVRGRHSSSSSSHEPWLPFILRFYLYANSDAIRIVHSIIYDGDFNKDFISGIGITFDVPLAQDELYDRHVRLSGTNGGFLTESVQGITGPRRDPGEAVRKAQVEGRKTPPLEEWDERVSSGIEYIPSWGEYRLDQLSPDGFTLQKRTSPEWSCIKIPGSTRSEGLAYLGGAESGGLAIGLKDFWQQYPTGVEVSGAAGDVGSLTMWLYSPAASPMDLRPYHGILNQETYEEQLEALDVTYEDYEPGWDTPYGIATTKEVYLFGFDSTPSNDHLASLVNVMNSPPILSASPSYMVSTQALGSYWQPPTNITTQEQTLEAHLSFLTSFYALEIEQRRWHGFWDWGDIMHTYDTDRHQWRYDVGGYAWDNSELSPNIFFWNQYLRTGDAALYRFAAQHARHTGETDVYHLGRFKGFGTRHGVQHWSDSSKQIRVSQPQYRKAFYYLSGGDERTGELLTETLDAEQTFLEVDVRRKVREENLTYVPSPDGVELDVGLDWGGLAAAWLIEWERRGERWEEAREKILSTMEGIANLKNGFVTGTALYSLTNGTIRPPGQDPNNEGVVAVSHLAAVFGLPEVIDELAIHMGDAFPSDFEQAWLDYCIYYTGSEEEQEARYGEVFEDISLFQGHSRLAAWAAKRTNNETLAERAWNLFFDSDGFSPDLPWELEEVDAANSSQILAPPLREASWVSTNDVALYGAAAIENLALVPEALNATG